MLLTRSSGVLLTRSKATSDLKGWGLRLANRASAAKARRGPRALRDPAAAVDRQQPAPATGERHHRMS